MHRYILGYMYNNAGIYRCTGAFQERVHRCVPVAIIDIAPQRNATTANLLHKAARAVAETLNKWMNERVERSKGYLPNVN